jgi:RNA polymerase sigma factor (sigma-70 family)
MNSFEHQLIALLPPHQDNMDKAGSFFFQHYQRAIKAYALKCRLSDADALEILGDIFLNLVDAIRDNQVKSDYDQYIWQKTRKMVRKKREDYLDEHSKVAYQAEVIVEMSYSLHDTIHYHQTLESQDAKVQAALQSLSLPEQQLWLLQAQKEITQKAFAAATKEKEGTIRQRWRRLRSKLEDHFNQF